MKFLFKLINGYINCPKMTNYISASPMNRIMSIANDLKIDLFNFNSIELFNNYYLNI
ncbi:Uncharacterized protein FWK35_00029551, partial [Aphis craccivora]